MDAAFGLEPYDSLTDNLAQAKSARGPNHNIQWLTSDFEAVASKIWRSGFGGTIKVPAARGMNPKTPGATDYHGLIKGLQERLTVARKLFPTEVKVEVERLRPVVEQIMEMRNSEFDRYLYSDVEYVFFTKKNSAGEPIDKNGKVIKDGRANKEFDKLRVATGKAAVHEEHAEAGKKTWYVLDFKATLRDRNNRAALLEAFKGLPDGEKSERKWLNGKFGEWCEKYGDESLDKPKHEAAAISHKKVIDAWEAVKAEMVLCN